MILQPFPAPARRDFPARRPGDACELNEPYGVAIDSSGRVFFADRLNRRVRMIDTTGFVPPLPADGSGVFSGDGGPAARAGIAEPNGLALTPDRTRLFIADVAGIPGPVVDLPPGRSTPLPAPVRRAPRRWRPSREGGDLRRPSGDVRARRVALCDGAAGKLHPPPGTGSSRCSPGPETEVILATAAMRGRRCSIGRRRWRSARGKHIRCGYGKPRN